MKSLFLRLQDWFVALPEKLYPFKQEIEGTWVRGIRAYEKAHGKRITIGGTGETSYRVMIYRGTWHLFGSVVLLISLTIIANLLFGSEVALYILMAMSIAALCLQEFVLHSRRYGQTTKKGIFDILTWAAPMLAYVAFVVL